MVVDNNIFTIFVDKAWVVGDTCIYTDNPFDRLKAKSVISKKREAFIEKLRQDGFNIIFDRKDINDETIFLIMDNKSLCGDEIPIEEYQKMFNKKIAENAGKYYNYPLSLTIEEFFEHPFFPAVFKNQLENGGTDKFLISNMDQLRKIVSFYKNNDNPKYKELFACSIFQQFLKTPSKYATYLRVLVGGFGNVLGASLKYSARVYMKNDLNGPFEQVFLNPNSEYFINAEKMFNYYSGGENIFFSQPKYSDEKKRILIETGFDPSNLSLPKEVLEVCKNIMINCHREIGVLCGIDFMLNESDGKWYYLENQAFPAIEEWAQNKGIRVPSIKNLKGYLNYLELELQPRYEALMLLINEKKKNVIENISGNENFMELKLEKNN